MPFCEQMANVGSEVSRALTWRAKGKREFAEKALQRAFELLDMTIRPGQPFSRLKELSRLKECLADFFYGPNEYASTDVLWRRYFDHFHFAARRGR